MTVVAVASAKASPGATTLSLALAATWPRAGVGSFVIEADTDGGSLAARLGLGYEPGLVSLAAAARRGVDEGVLAAHAQRLGEDLAVVPGPPSPQQAQAALSAVGDRLAHQLIELVGTFIIDVGRIGPGSPALPLARAADLCLLVARPRLDEVQHVEPRLRMLEQGGCRVGLVCIGTSPYSPTEVADSVSAELVGVVADDAKGAGLMCGGPGDDKALRRSMLWRTAGDLASAIAVRAAELPVDGEGAAPVAVATPEVAG